MSEATATPTPTPEPFRQNLSALRNAVFELHKILIESERATYEQTVGTIPSPGYFLQLLTTDPWFAWLHPLSQMVVTMDVALDSKKDPLTAAAAEVESLTDREREVLELVMHGHNNKAIADRLGVTVAAVKWHLQHIYGKLHVHSRTEAALKFKQG